MNEPRTDWRARTDSLRLLAAAVIGAAITAFALLNLNDVEVHWLFTTRRTPLIVVIVLAFVLGILADRAWVLRARRRRRSRDTAGELPDQGADPPELDE